MKDELIALRPSPLLRPQADLVRWPSPIKPDERRGTFGEDAELAQMLKVAQTTLATGGQDRLDTLWADAGHMQQLLTRSAVQFDRAIR